MTTLTRAKKMTRMIALGVGAALVAVIIFRVIINAISQIGVDRAQQISATADVKFGSIDKPLINSEKIAASTVSLSLDLVNGSFPQASATARVYKVANPSLSLTAQDKARAKATNLGFTAEPNQSDSTKLTWQQENRSLTVLLRDQAVSLSTDDIAKINMANRQAFTRTSPIGRQTSQWLQGQLLYTDIDYTQPTVRFVNPIPGQANTFLPQPEDAAIPTSYAQVSFLRTSLNELPFYSRFGKLGPIVAVVIPALPTTSRTTTPTTIAVDQLVSLGSNYLPIDKSQFATYPIISASTAYELLKSNVTAALTAVEPVNATTLPKTLTAARVLFVSLAYLEPDPQNAQYAQPVWLFEGRGTTDVGEAQWKAMVPAIDPQLTQQLISRKK